MIGTLDVGQDQAQTSIKTYVDHAGSTGHVELEAGCANQCYTHFKTNHTDGLLLFAVQGSLGDKVYMYMGNDIVYIYGDTAICGNLDVGSTGNNSIKIHGTGATTSYAEFKVSNGQNCVWDFQNPSNSNVWSSIEVKGVKFMDFSPTDNIIIMHKATRINGSLNVGLNQGGTPLSMSNAKTYFNHAGSSGYMVMEGRYRDQGFLHFETNYQYGELFLIVRNTFFIRCSDYAGNPYGQTFQPLTQSSYD